MPIRPRMTPIRTMRAALLAAMALMLLPAAAATAEVAGEYVVYAIRIMHAAYGGRIDIVGHPQGGMVPRWALRLWPDTRAIVDDLVGLSPSTWGSASTTTPPMSSRSTR
jgi:hypothetical protein